MTVGNWYQLAGALLIAMALSSTIVARLPLSAAIIYLVVGFGLGTFGGVSLDIHRDAMFIESATELALVVSLFTAGLRLRAPLRDVIWRVPLRLASVSMLATIGAITLVGYQLLGLSLGAAVILAAAIAPTDPVLASDVQVTDEYDRDRLRFGLTGEAGLNDGAAFPFVLLGLTLVSSPLTFEVGAAWFVRDILYKAVVGVLVGAVTGTLVARLVLYLRVQHREAVGSDEFLALGLLAGSYGLAVGLDGYGFLSAFAAGLALRGIEARSATSGPLAAAEPEAQAVEETSAPAYLAKAVLGFNQQLERIAEVVIVTMIGVLLAGSEVPWSILWFAPLLMLVVRPLAVALGLLGSRLKLTQRWLCGWFGIRGVGSLFYVAYAVSRGLTVPESRVIADLVLFVIAVSVSVHGVSVTPMMSWYARRNRRLARGRGSLPAA